MKKAILSTILLLGSTSLLADTTMCFKENHKSMSTIENTPLDGGICAGKYTVNDMKTKGWSVDDIKISQTATGMSFIYVLKTATVTTSSSNFTGNQAQMEANIIAKLEKKKEVEEDLTKHGFELLEDSYDYLTQLPYISLTLDKIEELVLKIETLKQEVEKMRQETHATLWLKDIEEIEKNIKKDLPWQQKEKK